MATVGLDGCNQGKRARPERRNYTLTRSRYSGAFVDQPSSAWMRAASASCAEGSPWTMKVCCGGRVLHHLKAALPDPRNTVLFAGYQGVGTRGRRLVDGEKTVKIHGEWVPVAAAIESIDSMSAHADAGEIMRWLKGFTRAPQQTFIVHGEPAAQDALAARIHAELGWPTHAPAHGERVQF